MESIENYRRVYLESLLTGSRIECEKAVKDFRKGNHSIIELYENVFKTSLYKIGELWEYNKISVAVEHMATTITEGIMNELYPEIISLRRLSKKIVISCVENEAHQVGSKMVADIFEKNGWDTYYLGANTPINELNEFCNLTKPDLIGLSLSIYYNIPVLLMEITKIRQTSNVPILIGGQALKRKGQEVAGKFNDVYYMENLQEIENYIKGGILSGKATAY